MSKLKGSKNPKIVVIGGGTGVFTVLSGLRKYPVDLSAIISMADDGGSTGMLREEFGILPPGDVRRALVALASADDRMLSDLFNYRFEEGKLGGQSFGRGHSFGNLMLVALERITGSFEKALEEAGRILNVQGQVIPVTLDNVHLSVKLEDGTVVLGETNIDIPKHDPRLKIEKAYLDFRARANKKAVEAILGADLIILGPGDLFTSIIPNLLVSGIPKAIKKAKAKKVFIVNTMTRPGETTGFSAKNFLEVIEKYLGRKVLNYIVVNNKIPAPLRLKDYESEGQKMVEPGDLPQKPIPVFGDLIRTSGFLRHDPEKLAKVLVSLL